MVAPVGDSCTASSLLPSPPSLGFSPILEQLGVPRKQSRPHTGHQPPRRHRPLHSLRCPPEQDALSVSVPEGSAVFLSLPLCHTVPLSSSPFPAPTHFCPCLEFPSCSGNFPLVTSSFPADHGRPSPSQARRTGIKTRPRVRVRTRAHPCVHTPNSHPLHAECPPLAVQGQRHRSQLPVLSRLSRREAPSCPLRWLREPERAREKP